MHRVEPRTNFDQLPKKEEWTEMRKSTIALVGAMLVFSLSSSPMYAGCTASAQCDNACDMVSLTISPTNSDDCSCSCNGDKVQCTYTEDIVNPDGSTEHISHTLVSRTLRDCSPDDDGGIGGGTGESGTDLGWCTDCTDDNGVLTPLGEFFNNV